MDKKAYRKLDVWHESMGLVEMIYQMTSTFPASEKFGLISQMQRASVSIPSNIAEGYGRSHRKEYLRHLSIARGSLFELETQLLIAVRTNLIKRDDLKPIWQQSQKAGRMLTSLIESLKTTPDPSPKNRGPKL